MRSYSPLAFNSSRNSLTISTVYSSEPAAVLRADLALLLHGDLNQRYDTAAHVLAS
jgi:hypothetical protein